MAYSVYSVSSLANSVGSIALFSGIALLSLQYSWCISCTSFWTIAVKICDSL